MADLLLGTREGVPALAGEDIARFSVILGEGEMAARLRREAAAVVRALSLPDRVQHLWKYTDPVALLPDRPLLDLPEISELTVPSEGAGPAVVLLPGQAPRLSAAAARAGLTIAPLLAEARDGADFGRAVPAGHGYFEALNAAAWNTGAVVRVPRGFDLAQPLRIVVPAQATAVVPRLLIVGEAGSRATVVEDHLGGGARSLVLAVTEILVGPGAEIRHVLVQRWAAGVRGHLTVRARVERDGRFFGATASLGGEIVKADLGATLVGSGARGELVGVALAEKKQRLDHHTRQQHLGDHTWSHINFKVAVAGQARSSYTGLIRIEAGAPGSEAYQENRNLLLSRRAHADSIPELEILTDDVSCTHGATVGPIDPEQIFYLESRGFDPQEAVRLLVGGFVEPTLALVPEPLRGELAALVAARLARLQGES